MTTCAGCHGDNYSWRPSKRATGDISLLWLCDGCNPVSTIEPRKLRGLNYYRRFTFQIILPVMAAIFIMIELGIHLGG